MLLVSLLIACTADPGSDDSNSDECNAEDIPSEYDVRIGTDPDPAVAGETATFTVSVLDGNGCPVDDLQQSHTRMIHSVFVSADLEDFQHLHQEDFEEITADDLANATFHFPVTFPTSGDRLVIEDFAHLNRFLQATEHLTVAGSPGQLPKPKVDLSTTVAVRDVQVEFVWEIPAAYGSEAHLAAYVRDEKGNDVTDLVQWLGADAHIVFVSADLTEAGHTHAWSKGLDNMTPGMEMPALYPGPYLPFHYTFSEPGLHKAWLQFARAADPEDVYTVPFMFEVAE
jgi:hypothetical protein